MVQVAIVSNGPTFGNRPTQAPKTSFFVILLAFMAAIGGLLFGYDTGIVSSAMLYIPDDPKMTPLNDIFQELIVSVTPGMAGVGSLIAGPTSDYFGRKKLILAASGLFTIGAAICAAAIERYTLLVGRVILGIAIGFASMIVPIFVSEASPAHIRGRMIVCFQLMLTFGFVFANIVGGGFSYIDPKRVGWRLMVGFAGIPALIQFIGFFFLPESPRWLIQRGRTDEAEKVLNRIYNGQEDWVKFEMEEIKAAHDEEQKAKLEHGGDGFIFMRVLQTPHVRKALAIGSLMQVFQQLCGINTLMYYTGAIIRSAGVKNTHTTIWISVGVSCVNFFCTFIPSFVIERVGRRFLLLQSVGGVFTSLLLLGGGFLLINHDTAVLNINDRYTGITHNDSYFMEQNPSWNITLNDCMSTSNCDYCVTLEKCGYCGMSKSPGNKTAASDSNFTGQCMPVWKDGTSLSQFGYCSSAANIDDNGGNYSWDATSCATQFTWLPIVLMVIYLAFFSSGFGPVAWVFNAEVYPLWARSTCVSFATTMNWIFNLIIALTFLTLSEAVTKYGAFFLYAAITFVAFVFFYIFVPETKGIPIEEVEMLFMTKEKRREVKLLLDHGKGGLEDKAVRYSSISDESDDKNKY